MFYDSFTLLQQNTFHFVVSSCRTKDIDIKQCDIRLVRHEAEFYGIGPLVKRLLLCEEMDHSGCGDLLFYCLLPAPSKYSIE